LCAGTAVVDGEFSIAGKVLALALSMAVLAGAAWEVPRICSETNAGQPTRYLNQVVVQVGRTENSAYFKIARLKIEIQLASRTPLSAGKWRPSSPTTSATQPHPMRRKTA